MHRYIHIHMHTRIYIYIYIYMHALIHTLIRISTCMSMSYFFKIDARAESYLRNWKQRVDNYGNKNVKTKFTTLISLLRIICPRHATEWFIHTISSYGIRQWNFCRSYKRVMSQNGFALPQVNIGIYTRQDLLQALWPSCPTWVCFYNIYFQSY